MKFNRLLCVLLVASCIIAPLQTWAQGALTPASGPAPTMKTLDQIYGEITKLTPSSPLTLPTIVGPAQQGAIHMSVKGQKQGQIKGESTISGIEGTIVCVGFSHEVVSPRDAATGLPTGKRQHKAIKLLKYIDRTSPQLYSALVFNETLTNVILNFYQTNSRGLAINIYRITLTNASISRMASDFPNLETIEMTYQKIEWTHVPSEVTAMDDWAVTP